MSTQKIEVDKKTFAGLRSVRKKRNLSMIKAAEQIGGLSWGYLGEIERLEAYPDDLLEKHLLSWMQNDTPATPHGSSGHISIPHLSVAASAGGGSLVGSEQIVDYVQFRPEWLTAAKGIKPENLLIVSVMGDSMEPTLYDGELVVLDTAQHFKSDGVYVVSEGDRLWVKRVQYRIGGELVLKSDNSKYDPQIFRDNDLDGVRIIGRVVLKVGVV
jgi:phage repressor protein C with HTH and peptisase S24 domain